MSDLATGDESGNGMKMISSSSIKMFVIVIVAIITMNLFTIIYICCSLRKSAADETKSKYRYETDIDDIAEDITFMDQ